MPVNISYNRLFEIQILNQYYRDWICRDFSIVPTAATQALMANYKLLARKTENGLIILAKLDENDQLQIPIPLTEGFKLVFELRLNTPHYFNFTDLPMQKPAIDYLNAGKKAGYYFANLYDNEHTTTNPDPVFDLKLLSRQSGQEVSEEDEVVYFPKIANIQLPVENNTLSLELTSFDNSPFDTVTVNEPDNFSNHDADLSAIPSGFYSLNLNGGTNQRIYLDDTFFNQAPFGLIEIFHHSDVPADYRFVTGAGNNEVEHQVYHIWFRNRSAIWRYVFPTGTAANLDIEHTDSGDNFNDLVTPDAVFYDSPNDLELLEAYQEVILDLQGNNNVKLPNPDGTIVKPVVDNLGVITGFNAEVYV